MIDTPHTDTADTIRIDLPASLKYLNVLGGCLTALLTRIPNLHDEESISYNVQLAVHEICTNIAVHSYANRKSEGRIRVEIALDAQNNSLTVRLQDDGEPFDESKVNEPNLGVGQEHGYGLFLARNLMDKVLYQRQHDQNVWSLTKYL